MFDWPMSRDTPGGLALAAAFLLACSGAARAQAPDLALRLEGGKVVLSWEGESGFEYTVEASPDLQGWSDATAGQPLAGAGAPLEFSWPTGEADPLTDRSFFRLRASLRDLEIQGDGIDNDGDGQIDEPGEFLVTSLGRTSIARPTITWDPAVGAENYSLRVSPEPGCPDGPSLLYQDTSISGTDEALPRPLPDGTYYACVTAHNAGGTTPMANPDASFQIDTSGPGPFSITGPLPGTTLTEPEITVTWAAADGAVHYDLILATDPDCALISTSFKDNVTATTHTFTDVPEGGGYYVCVTAEDDIGNRTAATPFGQGPLTVDIPVSASAHRIIFATSTGFSVSGNPMFPPDGGTFNGHLGADFNCTDSAFTAGLVPGWNGTDIHYRALISTQALAAKDKFQFEEPLYNTHGDLIANGTADLFDGSIQNPVNYNEFGQLITSGFLAWTGANAGGNWSGSSCGEYNNPVFFAFSMVGDVTAKGGNWIQLNEPECTQSYRLYCISPLIDQTQPGALKATEPADKNAPASSVDLSPPAATHRRASATAP